MHTHGRFRVDESRRLRSTAEKPEEGIPGPSRAARLGGLSAGEETVSLHPDVSQGDSDGLRLPQAAKLLMDERHDVEKMTRGVSGKPA